MANDQTTALIGPRGVALAGGLFHGAFEAMEIAGDASDRRFFRLTGGGRSAVLMVHPEPLGPTAPLYSNHRIMSAIGAPVAPILAHDDPGGLVLVDDLGDLTLQRFLTSGTVSAAERRALYLKGCDLIVLMQREGLREARDDEFASRNALDRDRFVFELDHFHRHFILGPGQAGLEPGEEALLKSFYENLAERCAALPAVYCHRDFQSRNLMVRDGGLFMIDFQDARRGPYTYDAASLLRDSSLDLDESLVDEMLIYMAESLGHGPEELRRDFDFMSLQRNLKDLGTFAFMATVRDRRDYLAYVPRTIASVRRTLLRDRRYDLPFAVLDRTLVPPVL